MEILKDVEGMLTTRSWKKKVRKGGILREKYLRIGESAVDGQNKTNVRRKVKKGLKNKNIKEKKT